MAKIMGSNVDNDWKARMDLETLMEACKIKKDKKRMDAVRKVAKVRKQELADSIGEVAEIAEATDKY